MYQIPVVFQMEGVDTLDAWLNQQRNTPKVSFS